MINCSKIGGKCPYPIEKDYNYIFVIMPFDGFNSIYDTVKQAVKSLSGKKFYIERADEKYTHLSIWCSRICKNIRKSKYCIVDTTGRNPNVFYELGFAHAIAGTKSIILTQNIEEAPFDIKDIGHIVYSQQELPKLRIDLSNALKDLETEENLKKEDNKETKFSSEELKLIAYQIKPLLLRELVNETLNRLKTIDTK